MTNRLQLEIGKRYVRRDGNVTSRLVETACSSYPFRDPMSDRTYDTHGYWINEQGFDKEDLISELQSDIEYIFTNPQEWPTFTDDVTHYLPLRNGEQDGFLVEDTLTVFHGNPNTGGNGNASIYESLEQLIEGGWKIV